MWCIPPENDGEFVAAMEDVLEVYHRPYDARRPLICVDESHRQLIGECRTPIPPAPGRAQRYDYEYVRNGTANLFLAFEPLAGWRHVAVTEHRCRRDWAQFVQQLVNGPYRDADTLVLVMDQLNTHSLGSLYETFEPAEARRIAQKLEIHHTPRHGSWLNMAEIEFSAMAHQCLPPRMENRQALASALQPWELLRNRNRCGANWRFTSADARIKLRRLYPPIDG